MNRKHRKQHSLRQYRLRVRTVRRDPIDYAALARAALEQAALTQHAEATAPATEQHLSRRADEINGDTEAGDDHLA